MAQTWLFRGRRHLTMQLAGEAALVVVLGATMVFAWSDGRPNGDNFTATLPARLTMTPFAPNLSGAQNTSGEASAGSSSATAKLFIPTAPPVQLLIPSLDVHRPVEAVGVDRSGVMNLPANFWNAGWYTGSPIPGAPGDAVIEGHAGYPGEPLIFGRLVTLRPGDRIVVVLGDGSRRLFLVESMTSLPVGTAPSGMAEPYGLPRLTLITCTGHFDKNSYSYSERLVVEASYAGRV